MPRRGPARGVSVAVASVSAPPTPPAALSDDAYHANLATLRRSWKWAAFSQFYFTFAPLFLMHDVPISVRQDLRVCVCQSLDSCCTQEIEDDLARSTRVHIPRVIQRLLYTLTQDRKIS